VIPIYDLKAIADSAVENIKIVSSNGEITLNTAAIEDLIADAPGAAAIEMVTNREEAREILTDAQRAALGGSLTRAVYDVSVYVSGSKLENFATSSGKLTIGLPYELQSGESTDGVWVYYVPENGPSERMTEGRKYERGMAFFDTSHLSAYAVVYEKGDSKPAESSEQGGSSGGGGCDAGLAAGLAIAALALATAPKRAKR
jgi:hypothetical protein